MSKAITLFCLLLLFSCSCKPEAKGLLNEIIVLVSPEDKPFLIPVLSQLFSPIINTPQEEHLFNLSYKDPWQLEDYKYNSNLFIASLDFPKDSTGDLLMNNILKKQNLTSSTFLLEELYAKNQMIMGIHVLDGIALHVEIEKHGTWITSQFEDSFNRNLKSNVYSHGINDEISEFVAVILGYTLDFQPDFQIIRTDSMKQFVWTGRGYPYRWITLHKSQRNKFVKPDSAWLQLELDFNLNIPEITVSRDYQTYEKLHYNGKEIPILRGLYDHVASESGGPFFVYIFDTELPNEVILISGFVNYPGREKMLLLKQLEIIARTLYKKGIN